MRFSMDSIYNIPNLLSFSRALIGFLVALFFEYLSSPTVFVLVVFGVVSDLLDGYLARIMHCQSNFGAQLDPLCDAFFVMGLMLYVLQINHLSLVYFLVLLIRYLVIASYHYDLMQCGHDNLASLWTGKWSSGLVMACLVYYSAHNYGISFHAVDAVFPLFFMVTVVMLMVSWCFYYQRYLHLMSDGSREVNDRG